MRVIGNLIRVRDSDLPWPEKVRQGIFDQFDEQDVPYYAATFVTLSELYTKAREKKNESLFDAFRRHKEVWIEILQEGIDQGYAGGGVSAKMAYFALTGMCNWVYKWYSEKGALTTKEIGEQFARLFLDGFAKRKPVGKLT